MPYVPLKCRVYDLRHLQEYLSELEAWDPSLKKRFGMIRETLKKTKRKKSLASFLEPKEIRLWKRDLNADITILKQYCRMKDSEEREKQREQKEEQQKKERRGERNLTQLPTKQVLSILINRIDELSEKIEEVLECLKSKKS